MARLAEYNESKVLEKAMLLFWKKGYEAVSIRDILDLTNFNRHSLYEKYDGKSGFYKAVLDTYSEKVKEMFTKTIKNKKGLLGIAEIFEVRFQTDIKNLGCLMANTIIFKDSISKKNKEQVKYTFEFMKSIIFEKLNEAKNLDEIKKDKNLENATNFVFLILQGINVVCHQNWSKEKKNNTIQETLLYLKN